MHAEKTVTKISRSYIKFAREMAAIKNEMETEAWESRIRTEGLIEGQQEKTLQIARNLLAEGSTPEFVAEITGLDLDTIKKL